MEPCPSSFLNIKEEKVKDEEAEEKDVIKISYIDEIENVNFKQEPEEQFELILPPINELLPVITAVNKIKSEFPDPPNPLKISFDEFPGFGTSVRF